MTESEFLEKFNSRSLGAGNFNHLNHLWLGWIYIRDHSLPEACEKLFRDIKAYADSQGATDKAHFTVTVALGILIKERFLENEVFEDFLERNVDLRTDARGLLAKHYSDDVLAGPEAKSIFLQPDRLPFTICTESPCS